MNRSVKKFPCGCEFEVIEGKIQFDTDVENINLECPAVWKLLAEGKTTGIFQLESRLGSSFAKKTKPRDIEGLALLISAIRPGCLENSFNGKTVTQHLVDRYNNEEPIDYYHKSLQNILKNTLGLLVYQESSLLIVQELAGFTLTQADLLRRAIGHKEVETMEKIKQPFLDGCKKVGKVNEEEAQEIFNMLRKSERYSFNKCLSLDTIVETPDGYKNLDEINIGDFVNSPDGYVEVVNKYDNGIQELYEVTLGDGKSVKCTLHHQFFCNDRRKHPLSEILEKNLEIVVKDN